MNSPIKIIPLLWLLSLAGLQAQVRDTVDLGDLFGGRQGGFSALNLKTNRMVLYNPAHCARRFSPCSTFKIPNSLIGLETGVAPDTGFIIKYDSLRHPKDSVMLKSEPFRFWFQDLSLKSAFKYSCVWYHQELARRIGRARMSKHISELNYGNTTIAGDIDGFWLCGSLEISIDEQIRFLKNIYLRAFPSFSDKSYEALKSIMLYESTAGHKLYGKTGSGDCLDQGVIGWYVGFVETGSGTNVFAMNIIVDSYDALNNNFRIELTKNILSKLNILK